MHFDCPGPRYSDNSHNARTSLGPIQTSLIPTYLSNQDSVKSDVLNLRFCPSWFFSAPPASIPNNRQNALSTLSHSAAGVPTTDSRLNSCCHACFHPKHRDWTIDSPGYVGPQYGFEYTLYEESIVKMRISSKSNLMSLNYLQASVRLATNLTSSQDFERIVQFLPPWLCPLSLLSAFPLSVLPLIPRRHSFTNLDFDRRVPAGFFLIML